MILCDDLAMPEGPLALADGSWLVTELALSRGCVSQVLPDGTRREIVKTGRPNGLAITADGRIWVAETLTPQILTITLDGRAQTELTQIGDVPLLWPNDLGVGPDGALYLTDSGALISEFLDGDFPKPGFAAVKADGKVIRFDPASGETTIIDRGLQFANGIAFDRAGNLYASETNTGEIYRYPCEDGRIVARRERFGSVLWPEWQEAGACAGPTGWPSRRTVASGWRSSARATSPSCGLTAAGSSGSRSRARRRRTSPSASATIETSTSPRSSSVS